MHSNNDQQQRRQDTVRMLEIGIRLGLVLTLMIWCFQILRPFLSTLIWALVIAVAVHPAYAWLLAKLGGARIATSVLFTAALLLALLTPLLMLSGTLVETAREYAGELQDGSLQLPPPPLRVQQWPLMGEKIYQTWSLAEQNLGAALSKFEEPIKAMAGWFITAARRAGVGILQFAIALLVSGLFLAYAEHGSNFARKLGRRVAGLKGVEFTELASSTVRSVAQGVLGVAVIQATLAGIGFMAMGIPGAGLWTLLVLIMATVQLPAVLAILPSIFYVFATADTLPAVLYTLWAIMVTLVDNVLKPLLMGRGAPVPVTVIFLGAIGGLILQGIVGLFVGAIVLALGYKLFLLWLNLDDPEQA